MGLLMGIVPSNRVSNGLISEILGTVFEGTLLGALDFFYLPEFFDKLFQIHTVYVTASDIQNWFADDFVKRRGKEIIVYGDSIDNNPNKCINGIAPEFGFNNCEEFNKNYGVNLICIGDNDCRRFCSCFWCFLITNACVIPDFIGRLRNIYGCVKSSKDIEKCKNELEKYQKIHENHVNKIENKNGSGSSYEGEK